MLLPLKIRRQDGTGSTFTALINPAEMKTSSTQGYSKTQPAGTQGDGQRPQSPSPDDKTLSFSLTLDGTGAVRRRVGVKREMPAHLRQLEQVVGLTAALNGVPTRMPFLQILWGVFIRVGRLKSLSTTYTLFAPDGTPLRARIELSFRVPGIVAATSASGSAAATPRQVRTRPGQSLAEICQQMYGDEVDCQDIAQLNGLDSLRHVPADTALFLPGLASTPAPSASGATREP